MAFRVRWNWELPGALPLALLERGAAIWCRPARPGAPHAGRRDRRRRHIPHRADRAPAGSPEKGAPVDLGLGQGHRNAQHPAPRVRADTDGRKHGGITNHATDAHLLVTGIEEEVADFPEGGGCARPAAPRPTAWWHG